MSDWHDIEGFPLYSVNSLGQVRNNNRESFVRPQMTQFGVAFVGLLDPGGEQKQRGLAKLVAHAFMPQDIDSFDTPINLDGDRWNCHVDNLMWRPRWFAIQYHMQFKDRYPYSIEKPIKDLGTEDIYKNSWEIATEFGLLEKDIVKSISLRTYVWPTYQQFDLAQ